MNRFYQLEDNERRYLRGLARHQAEIAALPVMEQRRRMWTEMNDGKPGTRPPFVIETWTFDRDFMPDSIYRCQSEYGLVYWGCCEPADPIRRTSLSRLPNLKVVPSR